MTESASSVGLRRLFVVAGTAVAIGLLCGYRLTRREGISKMTPSAASAAVADDQLASQVARIEAILSRTEQRLQLIEAKQSGSPNPASSLPTGAGEPAPVQPLERSELQALETAKVVQMDKLLATEPRDRSWAAVEEAQIRHSAQLAAGDAGGYSIASLSCRTSICKMEVTNSSLSDQRIFTRDIVVRYHPDMAAIHLSAPEARPDGSYMSTIHIIRSGYQMPTGEE